MIQTLELFTAFKAGGNIDYEKSCRVLYALHVKRFNGDASASRYIVSAIGEYLLEEAENAEKVTAAIAEAFNAPSCFPASEATGPGTSPEIDLTPKEDTNDWVGLEVSESERIREWELSQHSHGWDMWQRTGPYWMLNYHFGPFPTLDVAKQAIELIEAIDLTRHAAPIGDSGKVDDISHYVQTGWEARQTPVSKQVLVWPSKDREGYYGPYPSIRVARQAIAILTAQTAEKE